MNLRDPFNVEGTASPPTPPKSPKCGWLLPLPEDAEPKTKREPCGLEASFKIRVVDYASDVLVDVCARHKGEHDQIATELRQRGKPTHRTLPASRRKAG